MRSRAPAWRWSRRGFLAALPLVLLAPDRACAAAATVHCRRCGAALAPAARATEVDGRHVHERRNPQGLRFVFALFSEAPGVATVTRPTLTHTWFPSLAWSIAVCRRCGRHAGWRWSGRERTFFGLVLEVGERPPEV